MKSLLAKHPVWKQAIHDCADPERASHFLEQLGASVMGPALAKPSAEQARICAALFSGSPALSQLLLKHPDWLKTVLEVESLRHGRLEQGLRREVESWLKLPANPDAYASACASLRLFKQREMLRIGTRDLARLSQVTEITHELSSVADVCLRSVWQLCYQQSADSFGQPHEQDAGGNWQPTRCCVFALGKLGGQELNYSSDVDLLLLYSEEGHTFKTRPAGRTPDVRPQTNHEFFTRVAKAFVAEVIRQAPEGVLYRVDLRLRPEGNAGPLVRSLASYENYYAQWGQTWERMMLIKARCIAGDAGLAAEFFEMIQPFRHPRFAGEHIPREIAVMKQRIEREIVKEGAAERNVKLGRGGIREIEFIAQTLQLLHAGRIPFLQDSQTLPTLRKLARYQLLSEAETQALADAYCFLRDIEHRLQMEHNLQTHTIPAETAARKRLGTLMGFKTRAAFEAAHGRHAAVIREIYDKLLRADSPPTDEALPGDFDGGESQWKRLLAEHSFRDVDKAFRLVAEFVHGPGYVHVSPRTVELARQLLPRFLALCPKRQDTRAAGKIPSPRDAGARRGSGRGAAKQLLSDPDRVLTRLDSFVSAYGARPILYETWASQPSRFELMLLLFDRSEFLAETAIGTPDLVDTICQSGHLRRHKSAEENLKELRHGVDDEDQRRWLRRYHQAELMRIGLRDITGLIDIGTLLEEFSALADGCLQYALEVLRRKYKFRSSPFAIAGLGKLGGRELNYGSDLDIIFVADSGAKDLHRLQRMAADLIALLSERTELGSAFKLDARLRPDGEKGLLVNTLDAYEAYYRHRARLWEIQTLSRVRPVAGDQRVGERFQQLAAQLTNFNHVSRPLAAWTPTWKMEIARMRRRIESERTPAGKQELAIKTGAGGLMDVEFIAQAASLENGWQEPNTLRALERAAREKVLPARDARNLIGHYRELLRVECILRRWSFEAEGVLPEDTAALHRVAVRCGWSDTQSFLRAVAKHRRAIREAYAAVFKESA